MLKIGYREHYANTRVRLTHRQFPSLRLRRREVVPRSSLVKEWVKTQGCVEELGAGLFNCMGVRKTVGVVKESGEFKVRLKSWETVGKTHLSVYRVIMNAVC